MSNKVVSTSLTERDAAQYVSYSRAYLRLLRLKARGPHYMRVGRSIRYRLQDLDRWLDAHVVKTDDAA
jgi:hypothetical protein